MKFTDLHWALGAAFTETGALRGVTHCWEVAQASSPRPPEYPSGPGPLPLTPLIEHHPGEKSDC